jgi:hypothetical protein
MHNADREGAPFPQPDLFTRAIQGLPLPMKHPDAAVLIICEEWHRLQAEQARLERVKATSKRERRVLKQAKAEVAERLLTAEDFAAGLVAHTPAGWLAKAKLAFAISACLPPEETPEKSDFPPPVLIAWSLVEDLRRGLGGD